MLLLALLVCLVVISPVCAQPSDPYPTVAALEAVVLPPRDRIDLARRILGVDVTLATPNAPRLWRVGDRDLFTAAEPEHHSIRQISATLRVVGKHIYLWVEDGAEVVDGDLQALAHEFDTVIYDGVRVLWGEEPSPGIDGDPRIHGLFAHGLGASIAAYFAGDHLLPRAVVPFSNEREMFFFNLDVLGEHFPVRQVASVFAHEFQHMIRLNLQPNEETWLNEGFSEFTQYALYGDIGSEVVAFLNRPSTQLNAWSADYGARTANYGAAFLFTLYFYERFGAQALRRASDSPLRGLAAFDYTLRDLGEAGVDRFMVDWALANWIMRPQLEDGRYGYAALGAAGLPYAVMPQVALRRQASLPYSARFSAPQYAAYYIVLTDAPSFGMKARVRLSESVSLIPAPNDDGDWFWYGNRADMSATTLTRALDLTGVTTATLTYRAWYDIEDRWDYAYVMVSADDGATWTPLAAPRMTTDNPNGTGYGAGYTGMSGGWLNERIDLSAYAGQRILIRFAMITDDAVTQPGIAIDDIAVPEIGFFDDASSDGGWSAAGWVRTDNRLPQRAWLSIVQWRGEQLRVDLCALTPDTTPYQGAAACPDEGLSAPTLAPDAQIAVVVVPFAPVTTVPAAMELSILAR